MYPTPYQRIIALRKCLQIKNPLDISEEALHVKCNIKILSKRRDIQLLSLIHKWSRDISNVVPPERQRTRGDSKIKLKVDRPRLTAYRKSPLYRGKILWDVLDQNIQKIDKAVTFRKKVAKINFIVD